GLLERAPQIALDVGDQPIRWTGIVDHPFKSGTQCVRRTAEGTGDRNHCALEEIRREIHRFIDFLRHKGTARLCQAEKREAALVWRFGVFTDWFEEPSRKFRIVATDLPN